MPLFLLGDEIAFPAVERSEPNGLLAIGGDLRPERLVEAYRCGIFPWYGEDEPLLWYSPDPRFVLTPDRLRLSRRLSRSVRARPFRLTMDRRFDEVIAACARVPRPGQDGTWITAEMIEAYRRLHRQGVAHSVEAWSDGRLVGGLYGVSLGGAFFGESMFALAADASKIAFVEMVGQLDRWGIRLIDCQIESDHLERFGAEHWPRSRYLAALREALRRPTTEGPWRFDDEAPA